MPAAVSAYSAPKFLALIPEELDLRVFRHAVETVEGPVHCWSYVSDGLRRHGQKELVFTLTRLPGEADDDYPRDPIDFMLLMYRQARAGKVVEAGGYSRFAKPGGFLGNEGPVGMTYVSAVPLKGVNYPDRPLAAFVVTVEEIEAIKAHGSYRLLSLLGYRANFFPFPPWSDRKREPLLTPRDVKASMFGKLPAAGVRGLMVRRQRQEVHVHLADDRAAQGFAKKLEAMPPGGPFVLLTDADPEAKARLVWKPSMPVETIAVDNRPDAMLTGGFIAFFLSQSGDEGAHVCEDGFAVLLRPANWIKVKQALLDGDALAIPGRGQAMKFAVGLDSDVEPVRQAGGHFYQDQQLVRERIKAEELAWFDRRIGHVVEDYFADLQPGDAGALAVYCAIRPGPELKFWLECHPDDLSAGSRAHLLRRLAALKPPKVTAPVAWALNFDLWGGTGDAKHFPRMPGEWAVAFPPHESPVLPDQILERVWPASAS